MLKQIGHLSKWNVLRAKIMLSDQNFKYIWKNIPLICVELYEFYQGLLICEVQYLWREQNWERERLEFIG